MQTPPWHAQPLAEVEARLGTDPRDGLETREAQARLARSGPNLLRPRRRAPWWEEALESLVEPLQLLLLGVGAIYLALGETADALTILGVVVATSAVEGANELRAKRAIEALSALRAPSALVVRDGAVAKRPAEELVPGDVVLLRAGDRVPADVRLLEAVALRADESALTGEAAPAPKAAGGAPLPADAALGDRRTMAWAATLVTAGRGRGLVVATGRETEVGRVARLAEEAREPRTPLQRSMGELSRWLLAVAIGFSVLVPALGVLVARRPLREMLLTGLTLAFATIPEELPILVTIVLGIGAYRLARRHAIAKHLRAAEALGSVTVVAADKTGTLTQNRMRVALVVAGGEERAPRDAAAAPAGRRVLALGALANDAQRAPGGPAAALVGDPTEVALAAAAEEAGIAVDEVRRAPVLVEHPFDDIRRRMSVVVEEPAGRRLAVKGAPESVLAASTTVRTPEGVRPLDDAARAALRAKVEELSRRGLRTLALAERRLAPDEAPAAPAEAAERGLELAGLAALEDPPRPEAAAAVAALRGAGVRVLMVTGDHPATARAIAERVGIDASRVVLGRELDGVTDADLPALAARASVFARIAPEHKLRVVRALQSRGEAVAVTGDGVNDAPALREAAVGVAMGRSGTDVAREAADLVLGDDDLATVTEAVRTGRVLFENLRKAVRYYLAAKVALVLSSLAAVLLGLPVPFAPVQIIVLEVFMDLGASTTFVAEAAEDDVMRRPPRPARARFVDRAMALGILAGGSSLGAAVLAGYLWALRGGATTGEARTAAFVAWMVGHVVLAAHMRTDRQPAIGRRLFANRPFLLWAAAAFALAAASVAIPILRGRLHTAAIAPSLALVAVAAAVVLLLWWEPWKRVRRAARERGRGGQRADAATAP